jgi:hypothetical protein
LSLAAKRFTKQALEVLVLVLEVAEGLNFADTAKTFLLFW